MWRHPALRPLSREHFTALSLTRDVRWAAVSGASVLRDRAALELATAWRDSLAGHFADEEAVLLGHMTEEESSELLRQHKQLRDLVAPMIADLAAGQPPQVAHAEPVADALEAHVRWEEQTLFQGLQARLGEEKWAQIAEDLGRARGGEAG